MAEFEKKIKELEERLDNLNNALMSFRNEVQNKVMSHTHIMNGQTVFIQHPIIHGINQPQPKPKEEPKK